MDVASPLYFPTTCVERSLAVPAVEPSPERPFQSAKASRFGQALAVPSRVCVLTEIASSAVTETPASRPGSPL